MYGIAVYLAQTKMTINFEIAHISTNVKIEKLLKNDQQYHTLPYNNPLQPVNNPRSVLTSSTNVFIL